MTQNEMPDVKIQEAEVALEACLDQARRLLISQLPQIAEEKYDFMPHFEVTATQLYIAGTMWRAGEAFDLSTNARDRAFICLIRLLVADGLSFEKAQDRVAHLNHISRTPDGRDTLAIIAGYNAQEGDDSLAAMFNHFAGIPEVSGAPYRLLDRAKFIAAGLTLVAAIITLYLGKGWWWALAVGGTTGIVTISIGLALYYAMLAKKSKGRV